MRTLPPVSVPSAASTVPAPTAAALPLDEPPGTRSGAAGLITFPELTELARWTEREGVRVGLPNDGGTGVKKALNDGGVVGRDDRERLRPTRHREVLDSDDVLNCDIYVRERTLLLLCARFVVHFEERVVRVVGYRPDRAPAFRPSRTGDHRTEFVGGIECCVDSFITYVQTESVGERSKAVTLLRCMVGHTTQSPPSDK